MEIGNQIKAMRLRRGITQETLAEKLGVTAQAVSKWERGAGAPDIGMLPDISAFFGVSIDELFALSDDTRMERIQNMLWDVRYLDADEVESSRNFLLQKAQREPQNARPHELLADMENHLAKAHRDQAALYAQEALRRDPLHWTVHSELVDAMGGKCWDWGYFNHNKLIQFYKLFLADHPDDWHAHLWLLDQLIDSYRFREAADVLNSLCAIHDSFRVPMYRGILAWHKGNKTDAYAIWKDALDRYPDQWALWSTVGDYLVRDEAYEKAIFHYRHSWEIAKVPRYVDPLESMAQVYELLGDHASAISVLQEELTAYEAEWHFSDGETYHAVQREIERLQSCLSKKANCSSEPCES